MVMGLGLGLVGLRWGRLGRWWGLVSHARTHGHDGRVFCALSRGRLDVREGVGSSVEIV